jgi:hypothetical protein
MIQLQRLEAAAHWLAAIEQQRDITKAIEVGGMIPVRAGHPIAYTETLQRE